MNYLKSSEISIIMTHIFFFIVRSPFSIFQWNGNSFFDKFYKVQNFFPYAIPIVLDNEPPRM